MLHWKLHAEKALGAQGRGVSRTGPPCRKIAQRALALAALLTAEAAWAAEPPVPIAFRGMCDASAAIAVGADHFIVASDEDSVLRLYRAGEPGAPAQVFDLAAHLALDDKHPETDIEGAAVLGDLVFWVTSHGRNAAGKVRESRDRFFAVRAVPEGKRVSLALEGQPYLRLLADLLSSPALVRLGLPTAASKAPKEPGALNIEGLAATPQRTLLIGFRNPIIEEKALVVPLLNPFEVLQGERARLGDPLFLDLAGRGVRDMVFLGDRHIVIAGSFDGSGKARLYEWRAEGQTLRRLGLTLPKQFTPEALVVFPQTPQPRFLLLSDDGAREVGGTKCKDLSDPQQRTFRAVWLNSLGGTATGR